MALQKSKRNCQPQDPWTPVWYLQNTICHWGFSAGYFQNSKGGCAPGWANSRETWESVPCLPLIPGSSSEIGVKNWVQPQKRARSCPTARRVKGRSWSQVSLASYPGDFAHFLALLVEISDRTWNLVFEHLALTRFRISSNEATWGERLAS